MKKLFSTLYGSGLYGTRTPTSDRDVKYIVLPDLGDLLLGKRVENKVKNTNKKANTKNSMDDVDEEFIPIQVFARDFLNGQTYAIELAFALEGTHAEQTFYDQAFKDEVMTIRFLDETRFGGSNSEQARRFIMFVKQLREKFLTSNIKSMMGYVVNQASLYSFKGERLNAVRDMKAVLESALGIYQTDQQHAKLGEVADESSKESASIFLEVTFQDLVKKHPKYIREEMYDIGGGELRPCFKLLEKTLPWTNTIEHSLIVVNALEGKYGARADAATENNVDWKATMHALRIVDEGLRVLRDHKLSFPLAKDEVARLLSIKRGELPLDPIKQELSDKLDLLKDLEKTTTLPSITPELSVEFETWLKQWMFYFYELTEVQPKE